MQKFWQELDRFPPQTPTFLRNILTHCGYDKYTIPTITADSIEAIENDVDNNRALIRGVKLYAQFENPI